jgi:phosphohistidine phosphatase
VKLLGLLRHAKSDWDDLGLRDFDRGLNGRGRKGAALMGKHIADHGVAWERTVASPAERVKRTLDASGLELDPVWDQRVYLASAASLLQVLHELDGDPRSVLLVGHNPGLQELIFDLVPPEAEDALFDEAAEKFPTAAFAVLECNVERWSELDAGTARLIHLARPRDLDPELGPEQVA